MSVDQLAHKPDEPKPPTTGKAKPSVYISPEVVREIFEGVSPQVGEQRIHAAISKFLGKPAAIRRSEKGQKATCAGMLALFLHT
jgi:hypothetical protein